MPRLLVAVLLAASLVSLSLALVGCDEEPPAPQVVARPEPFRTAMPLPTELPQPTATRRSAGPSEATEEPGAAGTAGAGGILTDTTELLLPEDPEEVVVQLARIESSPWEPEILADMVPDLSLQAGGFGVFRHLEGESISGWYQTIVTPTEILDFAGLLLDEVDIAGLHESRGVDVPSFATDRRGQPVGPDAYQAIYVHTRYRDAWLLMPADAPDTARPGDPDYGRLQRLSEILSWIAQWRRGVTTAFTPAVAMFGRDRMGWWSSVQAPYTPDAAIAFGTAAREGVPATAPVAFWGITPPLATLVEAEYGAGPDSFRIAGSELAGVMAAAAERDRAREALVPYRGHIWGPLWRDLEGPRRFLLGIRPSVPGASHVTFDYEYRVPARGLTLAVGTPPVLATARPTPAATTRPTR